MGLKLSLYVVVFFKLLDLLTNLVDLRLLEVIGFDFFFGLFTVIAVVVFTLFTYILVEPELKEACSTLRCSI